MNYNSKGITIDCGYRVDMVVEHNHVLIRNKPVKALTTGPVALSVP